MGRRMIRSGEAAWRKVVLEHLPPDLSWGGFCFLMGWANSCSIKDRTGDNHKLDFYIKAARVIRTKPSVFMYAVLTEMEARAEAAKPTTEK